MVTKARQGVSARDATPPDAGVAAVTPEMEAVKRREELFNQAVCEVHAEVIRTTPMQMARALQDALSTQLAAYITGHSERTIQRWARGEVRDLRQESKRRLIAAYEILQLINRFEAPGVAETWFIGNEPQLDFVMPARAIRDGELEEALAAARSFVTVG